MKRWIALITFATIATASGVADAQWTLKLEKQSDGTVKPTPGGGLEDDAPTLGGATDLTLTCAGLKCNTSDLAVQIVVDSEAEDAKTSGNPTETSHVFVIPKNATELHVSALGNEVLTKTFGAPDDNGGGAGKGGGTTSKPLRDLLDTQCPAYSDPVPEYDEGHNRATVVVTPNGTLLSPLPDRFDENDTLVVIVYADKRLFPSLNVARTSGFRVQPGLNILGADVAIPKELETHAAGGRTTSKCEARSYDVGLFAPGRGEVTITASTTDGNVTLGTIELHVDTLYYGMFTLGGMWTPLLDPAFGVAMRNGQSEIVQTETGSRRFAYDFLFTPFLWDRLERDVRKGPGWKKFWHYLNPSVGFVLDDPLNNVLLGASLDLESAFVLTYGVVYSHVHALDGASVGDAFTGTADQIPVTRSWRKSWFFGVSIDVRVAVEMVRTVLGTGSTP